MSDVQQVTTTRGFRYHVYTPECWCKPTIETCECGEHRVIIHNDVMLSGDEQPRMSVFSSGGAPPT